MVTLSVLPVPFGHRSNNNNNNNTMSNRLFNVAAFDAAKNSTVISTVAAATAADAEQTTLTSMNARIGADGQPTAYVDDVVDVERIGVDIDTAGAGAGSFDPNEHVTVETFVADVVSIDGDSWSNVVHRAACALVSQANSGHRKAAADGDVVRSSRYAPRYDESVMWDAIADTYVANADRLLAHPTRCYAPNDDRGRLLGGMAKVELGRRERGERDIVTGRERPRRGPRGKRRYVAHVDADEALAEHATDDTSAEHYDVHEATVRAVELLPEALRPTARHMLATGADGVVIPDGVARRTYFRLVADVREHMRTLLPKVGLRAE